MYQCLIQVEHQAVLTLGLDLGKIWRVWGLQRLITSNGCASNAVEWREVGILLEFLDFFTCLDDVVSHLTNSVLFEVFESPVDDRVQRPKSCTSYH